MSRFAYYNENDLFAAQWLRNLINAKLIPPGVVDDRSILDVRPIDLKEFKQCHFFAGIAGWALALQLSDWPVDRQVWTGSCPCQPFSAAGKNGGFADERHLWPYWFHLIEQQRPATIFGEQVASKAGLAWLDLVRSDLGAAGYACGVSDLGAACVGAPHIRQRLWFVADAQRGTAERRRYDLAAAPRGPESEAWKRQRLRDDVGASGTNSELADSDGGNASAKRIQRSGEQRQQPQDGQALQLAYAGGERRQDGWVAGEQLEKESTASERDALERSRRSPWSDLEWLPCTDGKVRPTQPGLFPLAHGIPGRVGRLRAYGNAIVPQVAAEFIKTFLEYRP